MQAPAPEHLIKSGLPTEAMVASVLVAKYGWHLPLYRQAKMLAAKASISTARHWRSGSVMQRRSWCRFTNGSRPISSPPPNWRSMRRRCRCSILGVVRRRPATSGRSRAMTGPGAAPIRRLWSIPTRRGEAASISTSCSPTIAASCSATAMPPTRSCRRTGSPSPSAGATCGASSSRSPSAAMRLLPPRLWRALRRSTPSRRRARRKCR